MMQRRKFMQLLGIGTASAPLAAKAVAEAEMAKLAGINTTILGVGTAGTPHGSSMGVPQTESFVKMGDYMRMFGKVPNHVERETRDRTRTVYALDPDLVAKKSWSFSVKLQEQRQRNYDREIARFREMGWYERAQEGFEKATGFQWRLW